MVSLRGLRRNIILIFTPLICACFLLSGVKSASALTAEEKQQWRQNLELVGIWGGDIVMKNQGGGSTGRLYSSATIGPNYGKITIYENSLIKYAKFLCEYGFKLKKGDPVDILPISKNDPNASPCPRIEEPFTIKRGAANTLEVNLAPEIWAHFPEVKSRTIVMRSDPPYPNANQNIDIPFPDNLDSFGVNLKTPVTEAINILREKAFEIDDSDLQSDRPNNTHTIYARSSKGGRTVTIKLTVRAPNAPSVFVEQGAILRISTRVEYTDQAEQPVHIDALLSAIGKKFPIVGTIVKIGERNNNRSVHLAWDLEGGRCDALGKSRLPKCDRQKSTTYEMHASFDPSTSKLTLYTIDISHPFQYMDLAGHPGDGSYSVPTNAPLFHNFSDSEIQPLYDKSKELLGFSGETSTAPEL